MTYTKQEKQKLERVIAVFAEWLKESDAFDLVWSDKVGYVLLDISPDYDYVDTARRIDTAEELCRLMLEDVAQDVLLLTENEHSMETAARWSVPRSCAAGSRILSSFRSMSIFGENWLPSGRKPPFP